MRLLLKFGYNELLLSYTSDLGPIMNALDGAQIVEPDGYGAERVFKVTDNKLEIVLLSDLDPGLPENQNSETVALRKQLKDATVTKYKLEQELKAAKKAAATPDPTDGAF